MFKKEQIETKDDMPVKRTYSAHLTIFPTSILTNQTLARLYFQCEKKLKFNSKPKEVYQFR